MRWWLSACFVAAVAACTFDWDSFDPRQGAPPTQAGGGGSDGGAAGNDPASEDCANGLDDDEDGDADCSDADCGDHMCVTLPEGWSAVTFGACTPSLGVKSCGRGCSCVDSGECRVQVDIYSSGGSCTGTPVETHTLSNGECITTSHSNARIEVTEVAAPACQPASATTGVDNVDACPIAQGACDDPAQVCVAAPVECVYGSGPCPEGYPLRYPVLAPETTSCDCTCNITGDSGCSGSSATVYSTTGCAPGGSTNSAPAAGGSCYNFSLESVSGDTPSLTTTCAAVTSPPDNSQGICCLS